MFKAITTSDNTANDKLMRSIGGPERGARDDRDQESRRDPLLQRRARAPEPDRRPDLDPELFDRQRLLRGARRACRSACAGLPSTATSRIPYDGAAPSAIVNALARLKRGELLSPPSTQRLLDIMGNTKTGANRLKGGLAAGLALSHKTGTGQVLGAQQAGYNDIGILTAPDGRSYAVAVMIKLTSVPLPTRMALMNNVVRIGHRAARDAIQPCRFALTRDRPPASPERPACSACRRASSNCSSSAASSMRRPAPRWSSGSTSGGGRPRSPTTSGSPTSGPAKPATSTGATRSSPRSTARSRELLGLPPDGRRAAPGPALCAGPGVQAAHRHVRAWRL